MIINTAPTKLPSSRPRFQPPLWLAVACALLGCCAAHAGTVVGPWVPIFKGVSVSFSTNTPGTGALFAEQQAVRVARVDLTDPDIHFFTTPRNTNYVADSSETGGMTPNQFATNYGMNLVINANFFAPNNNYNFPEWTAMDVTGLLVCTGQVVSAQEQITQSDGTYGNAAALLFTSNNVARFVPTNWPAASLTGIYTAVAGDYPILYSNNIVAYVYTNAYYQGNGASPNYPVHQLNPRTAYGLSADRHYLFLMTLDGRQGGYSDGAYDWETARWMQLFGASDAVNMDGGGSTTLVQMSSTGVPVMLNNSSAVAGNGLQRTIGSLFGLTANPLPGYINNILVNPDDTAATITWTTTNTATSQVQYGLTTNLGLTTPLQSALVTNHAALLTNLSPGSIYYYKVLGTSATGTQYASSNYFFLTTNYQTSRMVFDVTNTWKWSNTSYDGVNWTTNTFNDSGWTGPAPGLFWIFVNGTVNANVQPRNTLLPASPNNFISPYYYPYVTYYFRTHFTLPATPTSATLTLSNYVDDGAVFYFNGVEAARLRMPAAPTTILNNTPASTYVPCTVNGTPVGQATCPDVLSLTGVTNLVKGDNVMAVEVHNYQMNSHAVTFGSALTYSLSFSVAPTLTLTNYNGAPGLAWTRGGFTLQQAPSPAGPWTPAQGPIVSSPYWFTNQTGTRFFRLIR